MFSKQVKPSDVFWVDTAANVSMQDSKPDKPAYSFMFLPRLIYMVIIFSVLVGISNKITPILGWICLAYFAGLGGLIFYRWKRMKAKQTNAINIQETSAYHHRRLHHRQRRPCGRSPTAWTKPAGRAGFDRRPPGDFQLRLRPAGRHNSCSMISPVSTPWSTTMTACPTLR